MAGRSPQLGFETINWKHRFAHGGQLRQKILGRGARPLSTKEPLHLVFKANRSCLRENSFRGYRSFKITREIIRRYAEKFFVKIEQIGVEGDHIHLLIRCPRRAQYHAFFRVVAGQISQVLEKEGLLKFSRRRQVTDTPIDPQGITKLWKYRPFSRVVRSWKAQKTARNYVRLNELEGAGRIAYRKERLKGLSSAEWEILWT